MEHAVKRRLQTLQFGEGQRYKNLTVLPLLALTDGTLQYHTLDEALARWEVVATEVSVAGSVEELRAVNRGNRSVLFLNGEELGGAKRNRVLNASVLVKEASETRIPVGSTEPARWSYNSNAFRESGILMPYGGRSRMARAVHCSLAQSGSFHSNQDEVWDDIARLQAKAGVPSPPSSLTEVFGAREDELRQCDEAFKPKPGQVGLLAIIDGEPAGMDIFSLKSAYANLHTKLVRSYALEALLNSQPSPSGKSEDHPPSRRGSRSRGLPSNEAPPSSPDPHPLRLARSFLEEIMATAEHPFPSIGHGTDFRYGSPCLLPSRPSNSESNSSTICGSALVHTGEVIHAAFFRLARPGQHV